jgi:hypothetical protein
MINKELEWDFDEDKVAAEIKRHYPGFSEEHVYDEVDKLGDIYEDELSNGSITSLLMNCPALVNGKILRK